MGFSEQFIKKILKKEEKHFYDKTILTCYRGGKKMNLEEYAKNICVLCKNRNNDKDLCYIRYGMNGDAICKNEKIKFEMHHDEKTKVFEGTLDECYKEADKFYGKNKYSVIFPNMYNK